MKLKEQEEQVSLKEASLNKASLREASLNEASHKEASLNEASPAPYRYADS